ncbi:trypsin-like peptidase domain-containing protein [Ruminococcaceae bacterium OttesenSCG-928-L11]|nr:trypsin-like peptidase domain-containing protein [Ruminococcaceae bacterium OttesenSCG-928-L11]
MNSWDPNGFDNDNRYPSDPGQNGSGESDREYRDSAAGSGRDNIYPPAPDNRSPDREPNRDYPPQSSFHGYDVGSWRQQSGGFEPEPPPNAPSSFEGGYRRPQYQKPQQGNSYNSYRYDPKSGWQTGRPSQDSYQWSFQDYDRFDTARKTPRGRSKGLVIFTVSLVGVIIISLFGITGYSLLISRNSIVGESESSTDSSGISQAEPGTEAIVSEPALDLNNKPEGSQAISQDGTMSIPEIAKAVSPSVVGVSAHQSSRFYEPISVGSGIVLTEDGYIITNAHVVAGGTNYKVQLHDNTPYDAMLIGSDASTDLAILKIDVTGLTPAIFGDSDQIEVGETVVAIGNPSGLELAGSVTRGIVSAVNRTVSTDSYTFKYIQTDAAINPGNSGGALVNEFGQVIGINSSKIVATGYEGIGFAIPITDAKPILDDIIKNGRVTGRVMLGIGCDTVTEADSLKYGIPMGLEIREIYEKSDLRGKDVQLGDILVEIDGNRVYTQADVQRVLSGYSVGDVVSLRLYRRISTVQSTEVVVEARLVEN